MPEGLLFVLSEPRPGDEAEFHDWYDTEHAPARLALPGVHSAHRHRAADGREPTWLAWYDLDLAVLDDPRYRALRDRRSARETAVMSRLVALDRRVYELLDEHGPPPPGPAVLVATSLSVRAGAEPDLHRWYLEEHIPLLHRVPGWHRTRRYRLIDGAAPAFLALHEISGTGLFDTGAYRAAIDTPWRDQITRLVTARERRVFAGARNAG
jgi:hypothetical protein